MTTQTIRAFPGRKLALIVLAIGFEFLVARPVLGQRESIQLPRSLFLTASGEQISLAQARGSLATVFVFLDEGCPICQHYAPILSTLSGEFSSAEIRFVSCASSTFAIKDSLARFARDYSIPFPLIIDTGLEISRALNASVTPQVVIVGARGEVLYSGRIDDQFYALAKHRLAPSKHELRDALQAISHGREVVVKQTKVVGCSIN